MTKVAILGNCQAEGIAACIKARAPDLSVEFRSIAGISLGANETTREWREFLTSADVAMIQLTDAQVAGFGLDDLDIIQGRKFVRLPTVIFKGFQPDCTYIFLGGAPLEGLMGPYHSAIATAAYLEGLELHRALSLFNVFTYATLGYFAAYEASCEMLHNDGVAMGCNLGEKLRKADVFMHTINHPNIQILDIVSTEALRIAGIDSSSTGTLPRDTLGESYIWPIYPEIAQHLGLKSGNEFRGKLGFGNLHDVVESTYDTLKKYRSEVGEIVLDQDRPAATPVIERAQRFIRDRVI